MTEHKLYAIGSASGLLTSDEPIPFGIHRGLPLGRVPAAYLVKIRTQPWLAKHWPNVRDYIDANHDQIRDELDNVPPEDALQTTTRRDEGSKILLAFIQGAEITMRELQYAAVIHALQITRGELKRAAQRLGMHRTSIYHLLRRNGRRRTYAGRSAQGHFV